MKIIIAGAGKVGYHLAKTLSVYHDIIIIDKNIEAISKIQDDLDVLALHGNIQNPQVYSHCSKKIDFFIIVTNSDEVNIIASLIVDDILEVDKKIVRLKNSFFLKSSILKKLNIYESIFSSQHIAGSLKRLLEFPFANNIKAFKSLDMVMLSVRIQNPDYVGYNVREISKEFEDSVSIVGLERDKLFFIPSFNEVIKPNDLIYIFGSKNIVKRRYANFEITNMKDERRKNCIVFGADRLGVEITKVLLESGFEVKVVERDLELCQRASEALQGEVIVLNSKYGWGHLLREEGLDSADMFIASTSNDEFNMIKSMEAKNAGIKKVITINNDREYYSLMHSLGLVIIRGEKIDAYYSILEKINADSFITQKRYCGGRGVVLSKEISELSQCVNNKITIPNKIKEIATINLIQEGKIVRDIDNLNCNIGDKLILFSNSEYDDLLEKWMYQEL